MLDRYIFALCTASGDQRQVDVLGRATLGDRESIGGRDIICARANLGLAVRLGSPGRKSTALAV